MVCCHRGLSGGEDYHHVTKRSSISSIPDYSGINTKDTIREGCLEMRPRGRRGGSRGGGAWVKPQSDINHFFLKPSLNGSVIFSLLYGAFLFT